MKKVAVVILLVAVAVSLILFFIKGNKRVERKGISFNGTMEMTEVDISFKISGKIKKIMFDEGRDVKEGDLVAELEDSDEKLSLDYAESSLNFAKAELKEVNAGSRKQEIKNASALLEAAMASKNRALADLEQAKADRERFKVLYEAHGISKREFEIHDTAYRKALSAVAEHDAAIRSAKEKLSLIEEGARIENVQKIKAKVDIAEESLKQSKQRLSYTKLYSPLSGTVLSKIVENGEIVSAGRSILVVADVDKLWVRGYISERDLGKIKLGQKVEIVSDSYPNKKYSGTITYISDKSEFTPKNVQTKEERINFMYRIKVDVVNQKRELKGGMPVEGFIPLGE